MAYETKRAEGKSFPAVYGHYGHYWPLCVCPREGAKGLAGGKWGVSVVAARATNEPPDSTDDNPLFLLFRFCD